MFSLLVQDTFKIFILSKWALTYDPVDFEIDGVAPIVWNDFAFDRLILPGDIKSLLLAFAKGQRDSDEEFDDIIEGKGKGMIIQLNGPPGVGKTLTAEAGIASLPDSPFRTIFSS
jgi:SpoVK/Ycf46/Vps4 family AAA+-type ATPase